MAKWDITKAKCPNCSELEQKMARAVEALQAAADDLSGYVGYSYADEYRTTIAEILKEQSGVATVSEAESDEKGQDQ